MNCKRHKRTKVALQQLGRVQPEHKYGEDDKNERHVESDDKSRKRPASDKGRAIDLARAEWHSLLQIAGIGACIEENKRVCQEHNDAFRAKKDNAGRLVKVRQRQDLTQSKLKSMKKRMGNSTDRNICGA